MHAQSTAKQDSSVTVAPAIRPSTPWRVREVRAEDNYCIHVRFLDGTEGKVDMSALINSSEAGVFASLQNPLIFEQVFVEYGVVCWPGEIDLAPDAMYAAIKEHGVWQP